MDADALLAGLKNRKLRVAPKPIEPPPVVIDITIENKSDDLLERKADDSLSDAAISHTDTNGSRIDINSSMINDNDLKIDPFRKHQCFQGHPDCGLPIINGYDC